VTSSEFQHFVGDRLARAHPAVGACKNFGQPVTRSRTFPGAQQVIYRAISRPPAAGVVEAQMAAAAGKPPIPFVFRIAMAAPAP